MLITEVDRYFRTLLAIDDMAGSDASLNGLQVSRKTSEIWKIAFAVDACAETFKRAAEAGADCLFVHHGLFWGKSTALTGSHFERIRLLIENDLALYAAHLPLDLHPEFGNNAVIADAVGIADREPFGSYRGIKIGFKGRLAEPAGIDTILERLSLTRESCLGILPFGKKEFLTVGVISGGADKEVEEAISERLDLYITGELSHQVYHPCLEGEISLIAGGHYHTEIFGVKALTERTARDTGIETVFIDVPTGL